MIDTSVPYSPGWWMKQCHARLTHPHRQRRLRGLRARYDGDPPLPNPAEAAKEAYRSFQKKARTNLASMIVAALSDRMTVGGFATAADSDVSGDADAGNLFERARGQVVTAMAHDLCFNSGESYIIVGPIDEEPDAPLITAQDPRSMIGIPDPANPERLRAALNMQHDELTGQTLLYLYLPGSPDYPRARVLVARQTRATAEWATQLLWSPQSYGSPYADQVYGLEETQASMFGGYGPSVAFNEQWWEWAPELSGDLPHPHIPVVRYDNKDQVGEYEPHLDLLDRIAQETLNRMTIAVMQAFRQRAIKGLKLKDERTNQPIDYSGIFVSDPAAIWQLPLGVDIWESAGTDITPLLSAKRDDVRELGAVTFTPLYMMAPGGDNQTAEGANLQREGLVFKAEDRQPRIGPRHARLISLMMRAMGESDPAKLRGIRTLWRSAARLSLAERADAASKATNDLPRRYRLIHIWGFSPEQADQAMSEWAEEALLDQLVAQATAAGQTPAAAQPAVPAVGPAFPVPSAVPPAPGTIPAQDVVPVPAAIAAA